MKRTALLFTAILFVIATFGSDILTLNNQMVFEGKVTKIKNCKIIFRAEGKRYDIPSSEIYSIQFENTADKVYTDYVKMAEGDPDNCLKGKIDALNLHGKSGGHFVLGFLFGPFALIGTLIASPTPINGRYTNMYSKNKELFNDPEYLKCYRRSAKGHLLAMEGLGWGTWILFVLIVGGL
jgi:hypothetical protein